MLTILSGIAAAMALVKSQLSTPLPLTDFSSRGLYAETIRGFDGHGRIDLELPFIKKVISSFFSFELTFLYFCTRPFVGGAFIVAGILGVIGISSLMCGCVFVAH